MIVGPARRIGAVERLKNVRKMLWCGIPLPPSLMEITMITILRHEGDFHASTGRVVIDGIADQVDQHRPPAIRRAARPNLMLKRCFQCHRLFVGQRFCEIDAILHQLCCIEQLRRMRFIAKVRRGPGSSARRPIGACTARQSDTIPAPDLYAAASRGRRNVTSSPVIIAATGSAQFMGGVSEELLAAFHALLEAFQHHDSTFAQPAAVRPGDSFSLIR